MVTTGALPSRCDVAVVGGGHNGLAAAAYLARAGKSVLVLERQDHVGGLAVSEQVFPGVDARLSRYSYLVSLLPQAVIADLGLPVELRTRNVASYTPAGETGLLVDYTDPARTAASFAEVTGGEAEWAAWQDFYARVAGVARRVFPTVLEPLRSRAEMRALVGDDETWDALIEQPISSVLTERFSNDTVRGVVLTDALIGTFARSDEQRLRQNRCFLYHVIGNGTGAWDVPVGGMGAVSRALAQAAMDAGAVLRTGAEVTSIDPDGAVTVAHGDGETTVAAEYILVNAAPAILDRLIEESAMGAPLGAGPHPHDPEGAQLKINMVLARLPKLRDRRADPMSAFSGTFHVNEGYGALDTAFGQAESGLIPEVPPGEAYCHSLTDPSILGSGLAASGAHTMTVFVLHMPARLFRSDPDASRQAALSAVVRSFDSVLAEPLEDCLLTDANGKPCLEAKSPVDLEREAGLPGGHIFHGDLAWPFADDPADVGRWGVETAWRRVLVCGAGARRGGGVSGIGGHNAAMAVLKK